MNRKPISNNMIKMVNKGELKFIERTLNKHEVRDLIVGKRVLIAIFRHRFKKYNLWGKVEEINEEIITE